MDTTGVLSSALPLSPLPSPRPSPDPRLRGAAQRHVVRSHRCCSSPWPFCVAHLTAHSDPFLTKVCGWVGRARRLRVAAEFDAIDASSWEWQSSIRIIFASYGHLCARPEVAARRIRQRCRRLRVGMQGFEARRLQWGALGALYHYTASFTRGYTEKSIFSILTVKHTV